jgi:hypothetical protein
MKNIRLVKIKDKRTDKVFYQIQKKTLLFGWIGIGSRKTGEIGDFYTLEEAEKYYKAYSSKYIFDIEIIK